MQGSTLARVRDVSVHRCGIFSFALGLLLILTLAPSATADRVLQGSLCSTSPAAPLPALGGTCNNPTGVAVNSTGNGGVPAGTTYVVDRTNNRIQRFNPNGQFASAWGRDVIGVDEKQTVTVSATAGQYKLSFGGQTTADIAFGASANTVQTALTNLSSIGANNVTVTGGPGNAAGSSPYTITFTNGLGGQDVSQLVSSSGTTPLSGGSASAVVATSVTGTGGNGFEICALAADCKVGITTLPTGGSLKEAQGVAVNQTTGNVYVTNRSNNRVEEFSPTGGFIRAWGAGVATGGATGAGTLTSGSTAVTSVTTSSKAFAVGQTITGTGIPAGTEIVATGATTLTLSQPATATGPQSLTVSAGAGNVPLNERQTITLDPRAGGGTFTLSHGSVAPTTTVPIAVTATAGDVEAALATLGGIGGASNIDVTGPAGGPWVAEFVGALADLNVSDTSAPASTALTVKIGAQLSCISGTSAATTNYQWLTNGDPSTGPGATSRDYTTVAADSEKAVQCQIFKLTSNSGSTQASSSMIVSPAPGTSPPAPPATVAQPAQSGTLTVGGAGGQTLTCNAGTWSGSPTSYRYQWYRNGVAIGSPTTTASTSSPYVVTAGDVSTAAGFQCAVTATNAGGSVTKVSQNRVTSPAPSGVLPTSGLPPGSNLSPVVTIPPLATSIATTTSGASAFEVCAVATECTAGQTGALGGQFSQLGQLTVDSTGDVYVPDSGNQRVQKFDENGGFDRAWGWDVIQPAGTGESITANEQQRLKITPPSGGPISGGTYTLIFKGKSTTLPWDGNAATVDASLEALSTVGVGNVAVSGSVLGAPPGAGGASFVIEFTGSLALTDVPPIEIEAPDLGLGPIVPSLCCPDGNGFRPTGAVSTIQPGGTGFEVCTVAAQCKAGTVGPNAGAGGEFETGMPSSLAIGGSGNVYASDDPNGRVQKFASSGAYLSSLSPSGTAPFLLAGDEAGGEIFVSGGFTSPTEKRVQVFGAGDALLETMATTVGTVSGLGYNPTSEGLYASTTAGGHRILLFGPTPPATVQVSPATEITTTSAQLNGSISIPSLGGGNFSASYRFEYSGDNGLSWSQTPSTEASFGPSETAVSRTINDLQPNLIYRYRLVVTTSTTNASPEAQFSTLPAKPSITHTHALPVTGTTAKLNGAVNPNNSPTTYHFEYVDDTTYQDDLVLSGNGFENAVLVPDFEAFVGAGGQPVTVGANLKDLQLSTTYHFRIVATNTSGTTEGSEATFTTNNFPGSCPNEAIREGQNAQYLPDCRAFEQVSPNDKRPVGTVGVFFPTQLSYQGSLDGSRVYYPLLNGLPDATSGGELAYLADRSGGSWLSTQLSPPALIHSDESGSAVSSTGRIIYNSPSLSCAILESSQPLTSDTPGVPGVYNLYRRDVSGAYTLLTETSPTNTVSEANRYVVDWATPDCSRVLFDSAYSFLLGAPSSDRILYEWSSGTLRLAGLLPDGSVATGTVLGGGLPVNAVAGGGNDFQDGTTINSISSDGKKVFFTAISREGVDSGKVGIFVSENGDPSVNISQSGNPNNTPLGVRLEYITPAGSTVYFLAKYGLTPGFSSNGPTSCSPPTNSGLGSAAGEGCDLYAYDVDTEDLTDLSVDTNPVDTKGAGVIGVVDASDDGSRIYFAARGQLIPGQGNTQAQNLAAGSAYNIYLNDNGQLSFVGVMTGAQTTIEGGGSNLASAFEHWAADATPSGSHLLFLSRANIAGYASGGVTEAYRYSAAGDSTVCISCRTDGLPSVGTSETAPITYKATPGWAPNNPMTHRPRAMSEDGSRVFFTMPDVLAPGAVSGANNLYEWENGKVHLLAAGNGGGPKIDLLFVDSSLTGDHAFFRAKSQLVPQDFDTTNDLYDASIGGGFPYTPPKPSCEVLSEGCQGPPSSQPGPDGAAPSESFSGPSNPPAPKPQGRRGHKKAKKHNKKSHKRHVKRDAGNNGRAAR